MQSMKSQYKSYPSAIPVHVTAYTKNPYRLPIYHPGTLTLTTDWIAHQHLYLRDSVTAQFNRGKAPRLAAPSRQRHNVDS